MLYLIIADLAAIYLNSIRLHSIVFYAAKLYQMALNYRHYYTMLQRHIF